MNIKELEKLRAQLLNNEIEPLKIGNILFENKTKTWETEDWKEIRETKIQDKCIQCDSTEGLRLQHTWKPRQYTTVKHELLSKYKELIRIEYPMNSIVKDEEVQAYFKKMYPQEIREVCPKCESTSIRKRKTVKPAYACQRCNYEFDSAESKLVPTLVDDRSGTEISTSDKSFTTIQKVITKETYYQLIMEKHGVELEKEVLTIIIDEYIRYLKGEGTVTLCKRCGFALIQGKNLCPKCKSKYKPVYMDVCKECR